MSTKYSSSNEKGECSKNDPSSIVNNHNDQKEKNKAKLTLSHTTNYEINKEDNKVI